MKKLTGTLTLALATSLVATPVLASSIALNVNGSSVKTTVAPYESNGTTLVPLRVVSENLGAQVNWNPQNKTITITQSGQVIVLTIGSNIAKVNDKASQLAVAPQIKSGTTMVPIRFVSENLDCSVNWDKKTQTVSVNENIKTTTTVKDGVITVKNPQMYKGAPALSVEWMKTYLNANVEYLSHYNRYLVGVDCHELAIGQYNNFNFLRINGTNQPHTGEFTVTSSTKQTLCNIDILEKTFEYSMEYNQSSKELTISTVREEIPMQEAKNGKVILKGYVKDLKTGKAVANVNVNFNFFSDKGQLIDSGLMTTTDSDGYYEVEYKISHNLITRVEAQCLGRNNNGPKDDVWAYTPSEYTSDGVDIDQNIYRETLPTMYFAK